MAHPFRVSTWSEAFELMNVCVDSATEGGESCMSTYTIPPWCSHPCPQPRKGNSWKWFWLRNGKDKFYRAQGIGNRYMLTSSNKIPKHRQNYFKIQSVWAYQGKIRSYKQAKIQHATREQCGEEEKSTVLLLELGVGIYEWMARKWVWTGLLYPLGHLLDVSQ